MILKNFDKISKKVLTESGHGDIISELTPLSIRWNGSDITRNNLKIMKNVVDKSKTR